MLSSFIFNLKLHYSTLHYKIVHICNVICTGSVGRPKIEVTRQQLVTLRDNGFTAVQMAQELGCSASVLYKRLATESLQMRRKYTEISDSELDQHTADIHKDYSNAGSEVSHFFA